MTETLRRKYVNSTLTNKTCRTCKKEYPRTIEFFYPVRKNKFDREIITGYSYQCIPCSNERTNKWKKENKDKKRESDTKYKMTEIGFFRELYSGIRRKREANEFKSFEEFYQCWEEQKKIYGTKCPYTGIEMTRFKGRGKMTPTNISKDRILSSLPYSKQNIMFISWAVNDQKGNVSPQIAKKFLEFVKERFGFEVIDQ